jgi:hypothetical protein
LRKFLRRLSCSTPESISSVEIDEEISSFIRRDSEIITSTKTLRHNKLMPRKNPATKRWETSVCRSSHISEYEFWMICRKNYDPSCDRPAIGKGVAKALNILNEGFGIDPNGVPYAQRRRRRVIEWSKQKG